MVAAVDAIQGAVEGKFDGDIAMFAGLMGGTYHLLNADDHSEIVLCRCHSCWRMENVQITCYGNVHKSSRCVHDCNEATFPLTDNGPSFDGSTCDSRFFGNVAQSID